MTAESADASGSGHSASEVEVRKATAGSARLTAVTVLLGLLVLLLSQMVTGYTLVDETDSVIANVTLLDTHGLIVAFFALVAALALAFAVATGSRAAVAVVVAMGIGILLVFLFVDLPDVGATGFFDTPGVGNLDATGKASAGLWMELVGALVILLGAAALLRLDESQLRAIGPSGNATPKTPPTPKTSSGPNSSSPRKDRPS